MRKIQFLAAYLALWLMTMPSPLRAQSAIEIIDRVEQLMRGESSSASVTMDIVTQHWSRSLDLDVVSLGTEYALVRVRAPQREAGLATLKVDQEVWNYLPRVDRTIKVPPSLMVGAWMGSHFTNDDLVKESRIIEDYDIEVAYEGDREGVEVWELDLTPKPDAPVIWGGITYQVRKDDLMPTWVRYYDEGEELTRIMTFSDFRTMDGRLVPAMMTVRPTDKPEESTTVRYKELEFDIGVDVDYFSLRNLRARR